MRLNTFRIGKRQDCARVVFRSTCQSNNYINKMLVGAESRSQLCVKIRFKHVNNWDTSQRKKHEC